MEKETIGVVAHTDGCIFGSGWTSIHFEDKKNRMTLCGYFTVGNWEHTKGLKKADVTCKKCIKKFKEVTN